jgi:hypothetical protein
MSKPDDSQHPWKSVLAISLAACLSGCSIKIQPRSATFDKISGKGPLILVSTDEMQPTHQFLVEHLSGSDSLRLLVKEHGMPEGISVEREFLQTTILKLFYLKYGEVYVCARQEGAWVVIGAEPISAADVDALKRQQSKAAPVIADLGSKPAVVAPVAFHPDLRGQLKPPGIAGVARLDSSRSGYVHHVTFPGETMTALADWYTQDARNATRLARANRRSPDQPLRIGDTVSIPRALIRNLDPFPEAMVP